MSSPPGNCPFRSRDNDASDSYTSGTSMIPGLVYRSTEDLCYAIKREFDRTTDFNPTVDFRRCFILDAHEHDPHSTVDPDFSHFFREKIKSFVHELTAIVGIKFLIKTYVPNPEYTCAQSSESPKASKHTIHPCRGKMSLRVLSLDFSSHSHLKVEVHIQHYSSHPVFESRAFRTRTSPTFAQVQNYQHSDYPSSLALTVQSGVNLQKCQRCKQYAVPINSRFVNCSTCRAAHTAYNRELTLRKRAGSSDVSEDSQSGELSAAMSATSVGSSSPVSSAMPSLQYVGVGTDFGTDATTIHRKNSSAYGVIQRPERSNGTTELSLRAESQIEATSTSGSAITVRLPPSVGPLTFDPSASSAKLDYNPDMPATLDLQLKLSAAAELKSSPQSVHLDARWNEPESHPRRPADTEGGRPRKQFWLND